ncbi:MAG: hypothetical protein C5B59_00965 [Bacteroidetes bacterium]|nr:MAG: hypothetical protein C5B59_00965 [Bacteroidota bacterium]
MGTFDETEDYREALCRIKVISGIGDTTATIIKTILKLPEDVADRAVDEVIYIDCHGIDRFFGKYHIWSPFFLPEEPFHIITLNISDIVDESEKMFVVAHEIAHFILDHCNPENPGNISKDKDVKEQEADRLAESWGFTIPERRKEMHGNSPSMVGDQGTIF